MCGVVVGADIGERIGLDIERLPCLCSVNAGMKGMAELWMEHMYECQHRVM